MGNLLFKVFFILVGGILELLNRLSQLSQLLFVELNIRILQLCASDQRFAGK